MRAIDPLQNIFIPCNFFSSPKPPPPPPPVKIPPPPPPIQLPPPPPPPEIPKQKPSQIYGSATMFRHFQQKAEQATAAGQTQQAAQFSQKAERSRQRAELEEPGSTTAPTLREQMEALKPAPLPPPIPPPPPTPPPPTTSALEAQEAATEEVRKQKQRKGVSASIIAGEQPLAGYVGTPPTETGSLLG
jgi:hypothetical protein